MEKAVKRFEEKDEDIVEVFKWFKSHVIDCKLEPSIGHQDLVSDWNIKLPGTCICCHLCLLLFLPLK